MSTKIKSPNEKVHGFLWTVIAVVVIIVAVIAYIVVSGNKKQEEAVQADMEQVSMVVSTDDNHITLAAGNPDTDARVVDLYEDYSCPHCGDLAKATDDSMKEQIEAGKLIVHIHSLNFLDSGDYGHSTMSGIAAESIAEAGEPTIYWNYRKMLFEKQRDIYSSWKMDDFADSAKKMGASDSVVSGIRDASLRDTYEKQAKANSEKLRAAIGKVSSPQVIVDGVSLELANDAGTDFADWPKKLVDGGYDDAIAQGKASKAAGETPADGTGTAPAGADKAEGAQAPSENK